MNRINADSRLLMKILCGLVVLMVGLIVAIVVVGIHNGINSQSLNEDEYSLGHEEDGFYALTEEIASVYNAGQRDEAINMYAEEIDKALASEDYDRFIQLISHRSVLLSDENQCDLAISLLDEQNVDDLPPYTRLYFYAGAAGTSMDCGNIERREFYEGKWQQLFDNGEVEEYVD